MDSQYRPMIKDLPQTERPRERLKNYGAASLSNVELIAILLRTGVEGESVLEMTTRLLASYKGLDGIARASFGELCREKGVSEAKACQLLAALELGRRLVSLEPEERPIVRTPQDVANLLMGEMVFLEQEHLRVVLLNVRNQVMGVNEVNVGNVSGAVVRVAEVFRPAVRENCSSIILVHNHPSGDPTPSAEDIRVTEQVAEGGRLMDIELLDHIVLGRHKFVSLKERGLGFK
jgi:DNA repair protein RadC